ncbi:MAG: serine/threonine protein phosphatase, partial [Muribaculaceae bacterium]|nr:serine/threonine protein phosphatase [Muribaculaceae bacterium]
MKRLIFSAVAALAIVASASAASLIKISGKVTSDGKPVAGVPVTDGTQFVTTDKSGKYSMESVDDTKFVYITLPDGYEVPMENGVPVLFANVNPDKKGNFRHDFELVKSDRDMTKHILFVQADPQVYFDPNLDEV